MTGQVPNEIPAGTTAAGDGIVLGDGPSSSSWAWPWA